MYMSCRQSTVMFAIHQAGSLTELPRLSCLTASTRPCHASFSFHSPPSLSMSFFVPPYPPSSLVHRRPPAHPALPSTSPEPNYHHGGKYICSPSIKYSTSETISIDPSTCRSSRVSTTIIYIATRTDTRCESRTKTGYDTCVEVRPLQIHAS